MFRWKRPYRDWFLVAFCPLAVVFPAAIVYGALAYGTADFRWYYPVVCGLATVFLWRRSQMGVLLDGDRIKVRTLFRTRILRWDDVADVIGPADFHGFPELVFVLTSGERLVTLVKTRTWGGYEVYLTRRQFQVLLTRLRERLAAGR